MRVSPQFPHVNVLTPVDDSVGCVVTTPASQSWSVAAIGVLDITSAHTVQEIVVEPASVHVAGIVTGSPGV